MTEKDKQQPQEGADQPAAEFAISRIYIKDLSFEVPNTPYIFKGEWHPTIKLDIHTNFKPLEPHVYEVILSLTVTATVDEAVVFLVEVQQGGVFTARQFPEDQLQHLLGSYCPNLLFPYAREVVSDVIVRGGFPALYLAPINFDALFQQHIQKQNQQPSAQSDNNNDQVH